MSRTGWKMLGLLFVLFKALRMWCNRERLTETMRKV